MQVKQQNRRLILLMSIFIFIGTFFTVNQTNVFAADAPPSGSEELIFYRAPAGTNGISMDNLRGKTFSPGKNVVGYIFTGAPGYSSTGKLSFKKSTGEVEVKDFSTGYVPFNMTDVVQIIPYSTNVNYVQPKVYDLTIYFATAVDESLFVINDLVTETTGTDSVTLKWTPVNSGHLKNYKVYQGTELIATTNNSSYAVSGLVPGQLYSFKVTAVDSADKEYTATGKTIEYTPPLPDEIPPALPTNIEIVPDRYTALVRWTHSPDEDLAGYYIYLNDNRVNSSPITTNSYTLTGLNLETEYSVQMVAVDISGNVSNKTTAKKFTTLSLETAPAIPTGLSITSYNGSASLSWLPQSLAKEYKIYVDGVYKLTTTSTSVRLSGLENGKTYQITVSAVNDIGESDQSAPVTAKPSVDLVPDVSLGYSLKDVSSGVATWFSSIWLVLAFCIAIPLSFYFGNRVKALFIN